MTFHVVVVVVVVVGVVVVVCHTFFQQFQPFPIGIELCNYSMLLLIINACKKTFLHHKRSKVKVIRAINVKIS